MCLGMHSPAATVKALVKAVLKMSIELHPRVNETGLRDEEEPVPPPSIQEEGEESLRHEGLHPEAST